MFSFGLIRNHVGTKTTPQSYKVKKKKYFYKSDQKKTEEILFVLQAQKGILSSQHRENGTMNGIQNPLNFLGSGPD